MDYTKVVDIKEYIGEDGDDESEEEESDDT
jgi:hypothetical protein